MERKNEHALKPSTDPEVDSVEPFDGKRARLVRVEEGLGFSVAEHELLSRIGKEGICDCKDFDGEFTQSVSILFDDGIRLPCMATELELVEQPGVGRTKIRDGFVSTHIEPAMPTPVQSSITSVSFARSLVEMSGLADHGRDTNMEWLLWPAADDRNGDWSVARWMTAGDILFFYHTKSAVQRIQKLISAADDPNNVEWEGVKDRDHVAGRLEEQLLIADTYAGTVFACATLTGGAAVWSDAVLGPRSKRHWKGNIHAEIANVYTFARPVPDHAFKHFLRIRQGAITPLHGSTFTQMKTLIESANEVPGYLSNAVPGGVSFRDVDKTNWIQICCSGHARFIDESQLREYLVDHLLARIKDPKTAVHQECTCAQQGKNPAYADYCIRVDGRWVVVETKLNILAETNIIGQISKYLKVDEFKPNWDCDGETIIKGPTSAVCVVIDASGIYFADANGFIDCGPGKPIWPLRYITEARLPMIRHRIASIL